MTTPNNSRCGTSMAPEVLQLQNHGIRMKHHSRKNCAASVATVR
jgi:hypothetical protein